MKEESVEKLDVGNWTKQMMRCPPSVPGIVTQQREYPEVGVKEIRLDNNMRIVWKKTDYKKGISFQV